MTERGGKLGQIGRSEVTGCGGRANTNTNANTNMNTSSSTKQKSSWIRGLFNVEGTHTQGEIENSNEKKTERPLLER